MTACVIGSLGVSDIRVTEVANEIKSHMDEDFQYDQIYQISNFDYTEKTIKENCDKIDQVNHVYFVASDDGLFDAATQVIREYARRMKKGIFAVVRKKI